MVGYIREGTEMLAETALDHLSEEARAIFMAAVRGVEPGRLMAGLDWADLAGRPVDAFERVRVIGAGKAGIPMARAAEDALGGRIAGGVVVVPHGYRATLPAGLAPPDTIEVVEAGHPLPDAQGVEAARRCLTLAEGCGPAELLLVLISGGGSALWLAFAGGIPLEDAQAAFGLLLRSGATIHEFNTVRKHLSRIGGGQLAKVAGGAGAVVGLVISDVIGDSLSSIASGPLVPDPTTFGDAEDVLRRHDLIDKLPASVLRRIEDGVSNPDLETPKPGLPLFEGVRTHLLAGNRQALEAAVAEARRRGFHARVLTEDLQGEAREVGEHLVAIAAQDDTPRPSCLLWGGETTVTVKGRGRGGRNQEVVLGAARAMRGLEQWMLVLSGGTDGIDGPTDAAGAWASPATARGAEAAGLSMDDALADNDAYPFFERLGQLIKTGPTHTNVMDVMIVLRGEKG